MPSEDITVGPDQTRLYQGCIFTSISCPWIAAAHSYWISIKRAPGRRPDGLLCRLPSGRKVPAIHLTPTMSSDRPDDDPMVSQRVGLDVELPISRNAIAYDPTALKSLIGACINP